MKLIFATLTVLMPLSLWATGLSNQFTGQWTGPGYCFLDQFGTNPCQITVDIAESEDKITIQHCSRDTGSKVDACFIDSYTIQNESELFLNSPVLGGLVKVGVLTADQISIEIQYPGQSNQDSFVIKDGVMTYTSLYKQEDKVLFLEEGQLKK